jgi:hypothetical protein
VTLSQLLNLPCVVLHRSPGKEADQLGNKRPAEASTETVCELQQAQAFESESEDQVSDNRWRLFLPFGTEIAAADTVTIAGEDYEVLGEPWPARNPRTQAGSHIEVTVCRTAGMGDGS